MGQAREMIDNVGLTYDELLRKYRVLSFDIDLVEASCRFIDVKVLKLSTAEANIYGFMDSLKEFEKKQFLSIYGPLFTERRLEERQKHQKMFMEFG